MSTSDQTLLQKLQLRENHIFLALTILIGILAGLAAVLFTLAIKATAYGLFGIAPSYLRYILVPTLMSLFTGFLLYKFFPDARGSGVPQTEAAYHLNQGNVPGRVAFGKFLTGVLCIGSGHSMGREGPSVQIGAGIASSIGKWFHLSPARAQSLIPVAAAGALAGAFNTPVAAVLFALEEIIGDMNAALIGSTVVASVAAVVVERSILGNSPIFHVPQYELVDPAELLAYAVLGILGGILSLAFSKGLLWLRANFLRLPKRTRILQPAMGGLAIGVILIFFPQVMGVGYEYVDQALNGGLLLKTMIVLCIAKLAATIISYASGNAGGIFSPSLYLGAMAGGVVGVLMHRFAPFPTGDPGAYALVGMGATVRRNHPRAHDFGVHDFRAHPGLPGLCAANDCQHDQLCHLQALSAAVAVPRLAATGPRAHAATGRGPAVQQLAGRGCHDPRLRHGPAGCVGRGCVSRPSSRLPRSRCWWARMECTPALSRALKSNRRYAPVWPTLRLRRCGPRSWHIRIPTIGSSWCWNGWARTPGCCRW